jgi:hypothetical protein
LAPDKFGSESEANIDPRASSTSGKEHSEDDVDNDEETDESEGKEGYERNGGEGGSGADGGVLEGCEARTTFVTVGVV